MKTRLIGAGAALIVAITGLPLATEAQVATSPMTGLVVPQGASTTGQSGVLIYGTVTAVAPTYTTAQTHPLSLTLVGGLRVDGSGVTQPVSGTFWQATQPVSGTVTANAGTGTLAVSGPLTDTQLRATPVPVSGTVTANAGTGTLAVSGPLTDTQLRATPVPVSGTVTANAGIGTLAVSGPLTDAQLRATAVPISGTVTANAGTNLNTSALFTEATFTTRVNTQGQKTMAASTPVVLASDQLTCTSKVAISQTASAQVLAGVASQRIYICAVILITAADQSVSLVEGTGSVCATGIAAVMGGTTASMALVANGGLSSVAAFPWLSTATNANALCVLQSSTGNVSGVITYRQG